MSNGVSTPIKCPRIEDRPVVEGSTAKRCRKCRRGVWVKNADLKRKYQDATLQIICTVCADEREQA